MTQNAITSEVPVASATDDQIGHIKGLLDPTLRRLPKPAAQALIGAGNVLQDRFTALVSELVGKLTNTYSVTVNYTRSLDQMIQAGKYNYVNNDITADHFPTTQVGKQDLDVVLVHFGKGMKSTGVLSEFDKLGLRPVTLPELLAFGETHPKVQREFPIIALGSFWRGRLGHRRVPFLVNWSDERDLRLNWFDHRWFEHSRFAAVRK